MNDHDVVRGHPPLTNERYVQVLLSTCSTYDSQHHLVIKRNKQYISRSLLLIQTSMITVIMQPIVLTQISPISWHTQRIPPDLGTEVVVATSHPTVFHTQSGFNFLQNNGTEFLLGGNKRD
jgi:hypothetical protein